MTDFLTLSYTSISTISTLYIYLMPEHSQPLSFPVGLSLPVEPIIESTLPPGVFLTSHVVILLWLRQSNPRVSVDRPQR